MNGGNIFPDLFHRPVQLPLTPARNKNVRAVADKRLAVARPMPLLPPVTNTTFSLRFPLLILFLSSLLVAISEPAVELKLISGL